MTTTDDRQLPTTAVEDDGRRTTTVEGDHSDSRPPPSASLRWRHLGHAFATLRQHLWPVPWGLMRRASWQRLSPSRLWARRTAPLAGIGGCSVHGAGRALLACIIDPCVTPQRRSRPCQPKRVMTHGQHRCVVRSWHTRPSRFAACALCVQSAR